MTSYRELEAARNVSTQIDRLDKYTSELVMLSQAFIYRQLSSTAKPDFLKEHRHDWEVCLQKTAETITQLKNNKYLRKHTVDSLVTGLQDRVNICDSTYEKLLDYFHKRNDEKSGLENAVIHKRRQLMTYQNAFPTLLADLAALEQAYLLKGDVSVIEQLPLKINLLKEALVRGFLKEKESLLLRQLMNEYEVAFKTLIDLDNMLGYKREQVGLIFLMKTSSENCMAQVGRMKLQLEAKISLVLHRLQWTVVILVTASVILLMLLSISFKFVLGESYQ
ncbi:hypothetical protein AAG747_17730 [Rapidithrix thailandica]|uniref:Uncharacterized protein n=1 Tax=Rapidithrix thailandica TaxID=413964 RepID=A0AAW9SBN2_9BACT